MGKWAAVVIGGDHGLPRWPLHPLSQSSGLLHTTNTEPSAPSPSRGPFRAQLCFSWRCVCHLWFGEGQCVIGSTPLPPLGLCLDVTFSEKMEAPDHRWGPHPEGFCATVFCFIFLHDAHHLVTGWVHVLQPTSLFFSSATRPSPPPPSLGLLEWKGHGSGARAVVFEATPPYLARRLGDSRCSMSIYGMIIEFEEFLKLKRRCGKVDFLIKGIF